MTNPTLLAANATTNGNPTILPSTSSAAQVTDNANAAPIQFVPLEPQSLAETGLEQSDLQALILKMLVQPCDADESLVVGTSPSAPTPGR